MAKWAWYHLPIGQLVRVDTATRHLIIRTSDFGYNGDLHNESRLDLNRDTRPRSFQDILSTCGTCGWITSVFLLGLIALSPVLGEVELDKAELEQTEELSESLANSLLEFSVTVRERT